MSGAPSGAHVIFPDDPVVFASLDHRLISVVPPGREHAFETAMRRAKCEKGFFVSFDYTSDAITEIARFFREEHRVIIPLTVREILDEQIAHKLA